MTREQLIRFKTALESKRADLLREMRGHREHLTIVTESDPVDQVCEIADRDFAMRGVDRVHSMFQSVESALREIREGTFGVCAQCGHSIPLKRLEAVPWSPYCVHCQERAERLDREPRGFETETRFELAS